MNEVGMSRATGSSSFITLLRQSVYISRRLVRIKVVRSLNHSRRDDDLQSRKQLNSHSRLTHVRVIEPFPFLTIWINLALLSRIIEAGRNERTRENREENTLKSNYVLKLRGEQRATAIKRNFTSDKRTFNAL